MTKLLTITNYKKRRKWGYGYSTMPDHGTRIRSPDNPIWTGTLGQVIEAIREDATLHALHSGGTMVASQWFYDDKKIIGTKYADQTFNFDTTILDWLHDEDDIKLIIQENDNG